MDLYSSKPKGWFKEKQMKSQDEYELEKAKDEYQFRPKINDPSAVEEILNTDANVDSIKGVDKVMNRMVQARQTQMQKKLMTERGTPA